jgi:hypothetical protein
MRSFMAAEITKCIRTLRARERAVRHASQAVPESQAQVAGRSRR